MSGHSAGRRIGSASAVIGLGIVTWNVGNFAFFIVAGHLLGPHRYGLVAALLAMVIAAFIPLSAFQPVAARPFAVGDPQASALTRRAIGRCVGIGVALWVVAALMLAALAGTELPGRELALTFASIIPIAPLFLSLGALQGASRFWAITAAMTLWGVSRPVALLALAPFMDNVVATLLANLAGTFTAFAATLLLARSQLARSGPPDRGAWRAFTRGLTGPLLGMTGLAVLFNADVIVVKMLLDPLDAGYFGAAATLAKAGVALTPQVLGMVLLPQVARGASTGRDTSPFAALIAVATVGVGLGGVAVAAVLARPILSVYGAEFTPGAWMLAPTIAALIPLAVTFGLVSYQIARGSGRFPRSLAFVAFLTVMTCFAVGRSVAAVLTVEACTCLGALALHEALHRRDRSGVLRGLSSALRRVRGQPSQPRA